LSSPLFIEVQQQHSSVVKVMLLDLTVACHFSICKNLALLFSFSFITSRYCSMLTHHSAILALFSAAQNYLTLVAFNITNPAITAAILH